VRLPSGDFFHALMVFFNDPPHRSAKWNSSRAEHMQAVHTNRPHRRPGELMKVRMVMRIMSIHDALQGSLLLIMGCRPSRMGADNLQAVAEYLPGWRQQSRSLPTQIFERTPFGIVSFAGFVKASDGKIFPKWN
jgi:hypothetical protein